MVINVAQERARTMAIKITVRPSATATATVDIKESTKKEVEEVFTQLKANPGSEAHIKFDTEDERLQWTKEARAYAQTRRAGALRFRALPSKNLPDNELRFNLTDDLEKNGERNGRRKVA
jgi:hypothetical protein